jgi:hypothetical protein
MPGKKGIHAGEKKAFMPGKKAFMPGYKRHLCRDIRNCIYTGE